MKSPPIKAPPARPSIRSDLDDQYGAVRIVEVMAHEADKPPGLWIIPPEMPDVIMQDSGTADPMSMITCEGGAPEIVEPSDDGKHAPRIVVPPGKPVDHVPPIVVPRVVPPPPKSFHLKSGVPPHESRAGLAGNSIDEVKPCYRFAAGACNAGFGCRYRHLAPSVDEAPASASRADVSMNPCLRQLLQQCQQSRMIAIKWYVMFLL